MKCPKCGDEIPEGYMYCFKCGYAIQMVPDYEVDVEDKLDESRNHIAGSMDNIIHDSNGRRVTTETIEMPAIKREVRAVKKTRSVLLILTALVLAVFVLFFVLRNTNTYGALLLKANFAYDEGNYEEAVELYAKAYEDDVDVFTSDVKVINCYARSLLACEDYAKAEEMFMMALTVDDSNFDACQGIIDSYRAENNNNAVNDFILSLDDEKLYKSFKDYMTLPPKFSKSGGEYEDSIRVVLSSENSGDIFYTTDGSEPTIESKKYEGAILLTEAGDYQISAIFVNSYNMLSDAVSERYSISYSLPEDPVVEPEGGGYLYPAYITATVSDDSVIYYTTDGTDPTEDSEVYDMKLPMLMGDNTYKFRSVSSKGVSGNVISRNYSLGIFNAVCTPTDAVNYVTASLVSTGALQDIYGTIAGVSGHYSYSCLTAAKEGNRVYYLIDESFIESDGNVKLTGTVYAVDVESCMLYRTRRGPDGQFYFSLFY